MVNARKCPHIALWVLTLCCLPVLHGQLQREYSGPLEVAGYNGQAYFNYRVVDGDTILDGPFRFSRSSLNALLERKDSSFSVSGTFRDNYPEGNWRFRFGEFSSDSITDVVGYQYTVKVSGTQHQADGDMTEGRPDGTWVHVVNLVRNSEVEQELFRSSITFDRGIPQKSFRIRDTTHVLVGRFLRNGLAHDQWTLFPDSGAEASEHWVFREGRLRYIEKRVGEATVRTPVYPEPLDNDSTIILDRRYLRILRLLIPPGENEPFRTGMGRLLGANTAYFQKVDTLLSGLGRAAFHPEFRVRVALYPLDSTERANLEVLEAGYRDAHNSAGALLENAGLNILSRSDANVAYLLGAAKVIKETILDPAGRLITYREQDLLNFLPRQQVLDRLWPDGIPGAEIDIPSGANIPEPRTYSGPQAPATGTPEKSLGYASRLVRYAANSLESIRQGLESRLSLDRQQQEFRATEEQLIARIEHLNRLADSLGAANTEAELNALEAIRTNAENRLRAYSEIRDPAARITYGEELVQCLVSLDSLANEISLLPARRVEIRQRYLDRVWNPFTATLMDEAVKKRITAAYGEVLLPRLLERIRPDTSCNEAEGLHRFMEAAYQRMLELRDADTSRMERRLRREEDPEVISELFGLEYPAKPTEG